MLHYACGDLLSLLRLILPAKNMATDITYITMARGHMYLIAIMDWATRKVVSWRLSNSLDTRFCIEALIPAPRCLGTVDSHVHQ